MSDKDWDQVVEVHLKGAFACTKAAWPIFRKQKFGRIINTSSAAGLYGTLLCHPFLHPRLMCDQVTLVRQITVRPRWVSLGSPRLWLVKALNTTSRPLPLHQYVSGQAVLCRSSVFSTACCFSHD